MPCKDLDDTIVFYRDVMGCRLGRQDDTWVDLDFFGHQLVFHYCGGDPIPRYVNPVDDKSVQIPHFGVVLTPNDFEILAKRLAEKVSFIIEPYTRFKGSPGEQSTMFFCDPNDYALEFKAFQNDRYLFKPFESAVTS